MLEALAIAQRSPAAEALIEDVRQRYERNLLSACELLEKLLQSSEARVRELTEENRGLRQTNENPL